MIQKALCFRDTVLSAYYDMGSIASDGYDLVATSCYRKCFVLGIRSCHCVVIWEVWSLVVTILSAYHGVGIASFDTFLSSCDDTRSIAVKGNDANVHKQSGN